MTARKSAAEREIRRPAGSATSNLMIRIDPQVKAVLDEWTRRLEVPYWAVIEAMVRAAPTGPDGLPAGLDIPKRGQQTLFERDDESGEGAATAA